MTLANDPGAIDLIDAEADSVPAPEPHRSKSTMVRVLLGASLVLIAFNLRPVFSSASALLPEIRDVLGLSSTGASLLTTLPVVCLGLFSPLAPRLAQRIGTERTLLAVIVLVALGTALRGLSSIPLLFLGTALAGAAIAVGNVLLPGLVKRDFPDRAALMTGCYTMALCAGAASAAAAAILGAGRPWRASQSAHQTGWSDLTNRVVGDFRHIDVAGRVGRNTNGTGESRSCAAAVLGAG